MAADVEKEESLVAAVADMVDIVDLLFEKYFEVVGYKHCTFVVVGLIGNSVVEN